MLIIINKDKVIFQVDSGASIDIVNEKYTKDVQPTTKALKMWNGSELRPMRNYPSDGKESQNWQEVLS